MKKLFVILLALIIVSSLIITACAQPATPPVPVPTASYQPTSVASPTSTSKPTSAPSPTSVNAPAKTYVLNAVNYIAVTPGDPLSASFMLYINKVNEKAKGELKINYLGATEIMPSGQQLGALSNGTFQILFTPYHNKQTMPETAACFLSQLSPQEERQSGFYDLIDKAYRQKMGITMLSGPGYWKGSFYLFTQVAVQKVDDFKGMKFRSNATYTDVLNALGTSQIPLESGDVYTALERKMVQGYLMPVYIHRSGLDPVTKFRVDHPFYKESAKILINLKAFEDLPKNLQQILLDVGKEVEEQVESSTIAAMKESDNIQLKAGLKFITLSDGDRLLKLVYDVGWQSLAKALPDQAQKIRDMISKK